MYECLVRRDGRGGRPIHEDTSPRDSLDGQAKVSMKYPGAIDPATTKGAQEPLALILQEEYIDEPSDGQYVHVKSSRVTEWPVEFLRRPKRNERTIPDFLSPNAPPNRLDIIRGKAKGI